MRERGGRQKEVDGRNRIWKGEKYMKNRRMGDRGEGRRKERRRRRRTKGRQ